MKTNAVELENITGVSLETRLRDKTLLTIYGAAKASGYSPQHLRRLCADDKIAHLRRGHQYFFTQEHVHALFQYTAPRFAATR